MHPPYTHTYTHTLSGLPPDSAQDSDARVTLGPGVPCLCSTTDRRQREEADYDRGGPEGDAHLHQQACGDALRGGVPSHGGGGGVCQEGRAADRSGAATPWGGGP